MSGPADHIPTLASGDGILCLGPLRSGSFSLVAALKILGFDNIHHGVTHGLAKPDLISLNRVSWSCLPYMHTLYPSGPPSWITDRGSTPFSLGRPLDRDAWDDLLGSRYRGISDVGSLYAESLVRAYPEARVILLHRDFEGWARSVDAGFLVPLSTGWGRLTRTVVGPLVGSPYLRVQWDVVRAWIGGRTAEECRRNLRGAYDRHYDLVRKLVPREQLLEMRLGDGWEPLCEFLGVPVPDVPFPRLNDAAALLEVRARSNRRLMRRLLERVMTYSVLVGIVAIAVSKYAVITEQLRSLWRWGGMFG